MYPGCFVPNQKCGVKEDVSGVGVGLLKVQGVEQGPVLMYTHKIICGIYTICKICKISEIYLLIYNTY